MAEDREELCSIIRGAYIAGATAVHDFWTENPGPVPDLDPEFGEAADDYWQSVKLPEATPPVAELIATLPTGTGEAVAWRFDKQNVSGGITGPFFSTSPVRHIAGEDPENINIVPLFAHPPAQEAGWRFDLSDMPKDGRWIIALTEWHSAYSIRWDDGRATWVDRRGYKPDIRIDPDVIVAWAVAPNQEPKSPEGEG